MLKKIILAIVLLLFITGMLAGVKVLQFSAMFAVAEEMTPPPESVSTTEVSQQTWQPFLRAIGSVTASQGVMVSAEAPGIITAIAIDSAKMVEAGSILVKLDASTEEAELQSAEASLELAQAELQRSQDLRANNTTPQSALDSAEANARKAAAEVNRLRAVIAQKTIRAPFAGRLGIRQVNIGQYLGAGDPMVSLQALDPVYVDFTIPQQRLAQLQPGLPVEVTSDTFPGQTFEGMITAIHSEVDLATRNIRVRATLDNPEELLRPGMFTTLKILLPDRADVLAIPSTSIIYAPFGNSVFVVEETGNGETRARQQFVRLGENRGDFVAVTEGLKAGEVVVSTGAFKLRNGAAVSSNNDLAPEPLLEPAPADS